MRLDETGKGGIVMPKGVRMADIAKRVGVSTVTVSKALGDKEGVSDEIREKIKATAHEMGYRFGPAAKRVSKKTGNIGILIPAGFVERGRSFYWKMYENLISRLSEIGYYGILEMIQPEEQRALMEPRVLQDEKTDGLILIGQENPEYRRMLQKNPKIPLIILDSYDIMDGGDCVISDGYHGMAAVTSYLIHLGHRDICFVGSLNATSSINDRYFGYCRAMLENGLEVRPDMVLPDRMEDGNLNITLPERMPTAFACNCDMVACELIAKLRDAGFRVPEDISVAGFDDYVFPGLGGPEVTTYAVDIDAMVQACISRLLKKMSNRHYAAGLKIVTGRLIVRDTTGPLARKEL